MDSYGFGAGSGCEALSYPIVEQAWIAAGNLFAELSGETTPLFLRNRACPQPMTGGGETMMMQTYDGADVVDAQGEPVGAVARSYVDGSGTVRLLEVAIGSFFPRYRLIPVVDAQLTDGRLAVPFTKDIIVESPDASPTRDTLKGELLERVWAYYGPARGSTNVAMAGSAVAPGEDVTAAPTGQAGARDDTAEPAPDTTPQVGEVRDRGDVIEIPIVEDEVEVIRRPVVKEVLRVRKDQVTEQKTIDTTVRKERIEVAQGDDVVARDNQDDM